VPATLQVTNLCKSFGAIVASDKVSFSLEVGECLGVIGPNGAGKTSVFSLIAGGIAADAGEIHLDGVDISHLPAFRRARLGICRTFQIPQPFSDLTVYENVLSAASSGARLSGSELTDCAVSALERSGLVAKAGQRAGALPLLDRKRLELARAMALKPRVLLLDEIAGGLTEAEVTQLVALIRALKPELAIVWIEHVTHALSAVADRIVAINFGRKIAEGRPGEVMSHPAVQEVYMGTVFDVAPVG
jgi:branched-chain amino acid transport system ATP-binding protein